MYLIRMWLYVSPFIYISRGAVIYYGRVHKSEFIENLSIFKKMKTPIFSKLRLKNSDPL